MSVSLRARIQSGLSHSSAFVLRISTRCLSQDFPYMPAGNEVDTGKICLSGLREQWVSPRNRMSGKWDYPSPSSLLTNKSLLWAHCLGEDKKYEFLKSFKGRWKTSPSKSVFANTTQQRAPKAGEGPFGRWAVLLQTAGHYHSATASSSVCSIKVNPCLSDPCQIQSSKRWLLRYISTSCVKNKNLIVQLLPNGKLPIIPRCVW